MCQGIEFIDTRLILPGTLKKLAEDMDCKLRKIAITKDDLLINSDDEYYQLTKERLDTITQYC